MFFIKRNTDSEVNFGIKVVLEKDLSVREENYWEAQPTVKCHKYVMYCFIATKLYVVMLSPTET